MRWMAPGPVGGHKWTGGRKRCGLALGCRAGRPGVGPRVDKRGEQRVRPGRRLAAGARAPGPSHERIADTSAGSTPAPHRPRSIGRARDQVGCHANRSMRPRICPNRRGVKWLSASWRMKNNTLSIHPVEFSNTPGQARASSRVSSVCPPAAAARAGRESPSGLAGGPDAIPSHVHTDSSATSSA
jgi:hypothetical protein